MSVVADSITLATISEEMRDLTVDEAYLVYSYIRSLKTSRDISNSKVDVPK